MSKRKTEVVVEHFNGGHSIGDRLGQLADEPLTAFRSPSSNGFLGGGNGLTDDAGQAVDAVLARVKFALEGAQAPRSQAYQGTERGKKERPDEQREVGDARQQDHEHALANDWS